MSRVYDFFLMAHSTVRWWVLVACVLAAVRGRLGRAGAVWTARDHWLARGFVASVDLQVLLGTTLYFGVSPLARAARASWSSGGFSALGAEPELRFVGLIHPVLASLAAGVAHATWIAVRRTADARQRHSRLAWGAGVSLMLLLAAVPWPFLGHERPWFRF